MTPPVAAQATSQRARQREETRDRILEAAIAEFRRVGFRDAQIPRIAEAAGVVRGTFYFHFSSKQHVLEELSLRIRSDIAAEMHRLSVARPDFRDRLSGLVEAIARVDDSLAEADLIRDVVNVHTTARLSADASPDENEDEIRRVLVTQIEEAIASGELRSRLDAQSVASTVLGSIFGIMASPRLEGVHRRVELELLVELLLDGIAERD